MKLLLGSLLLAGLCWLGAAMEFRSMPNFMAKKLSGGWHPVANIFVEKQFPHYTVKGTQKGNLVYSYKYLANGKCKERKMRFVKQGNEAKFETKSPTSVQILDTDYESYIISYIERGMDAFLTLARKEDTKNPSVETKLKEFASSVGVTGDLVPVVQTATC